MMMINNNNTPQILKQSESQQRLMQEANTKKQGIKLEQVIMHRDQLKVEQIISEVILNKIRSSPDARKTPG